MSSCRRCFLQPLHHDFGYISHSRFLASPHTLKFRSLLNPWPAAQSFPENSALSPSQRTLLPEILAPNSAEYSLADRAHPLPALLRLCGGLRLAASYSSQFSCVTT